MYFMCRLKICNNQYLGLLNYPLFAVFRYIMYLLCVDFYVEIW